MGCTHSQNIFKGINSRNFQLPHKKLFKVINVDDQGQEMSLGKIEITDYELILHQENKNPVKWPLRLLRRYGHDNNLFTFECGRRCATGEGVYAFKCNEAEELFNVVRIATENSANTPESSLIDQINNQFIKNNQSSDCFVNASNSSNRLDKDININNQLNQINQLNQLNNNMPPKLPSHFYANDIREYMNLGAFDNSYINRDHSPLLKQDFDFSQTNVNLNYAKLDDLQLQFNNINNNSINDNPKANLFDYQNSVQTNQLNDQTNFINQNNEVLNAIKFDKKDLKLSELKLDDLDHQLNYTTIVLDCKPDMDIKNDYDETCCYISTAPATPIHKNMKYNDFKIPNSVPTSPTKQDDSIQQYSTIDFNKTKALTGIIKDLNQSDQNKIES